MKNSHYGVLQWVLALVMAFLLVTPNAGQAADRKTFGLRVVAGHPYAKGSFWIVSLEDFFCRELEKRVLARTDKYKVECKGFYGGSVAKLGEVLETVENGLADIGFTIPVFEMAKLEPYNFTFWIPFTSLDVMQVLKAHNSTIDRFPVFDQILQKYKQKRCGHAYLFQTSYQMITTFPIQTMEDLKGRKIGHGGPMLPWLAALGATSVQATYNEVYTSIDTGVINGYAMPANVVAGFKIYEVAKHYTEVGYGATQAAVLTISLNTWNRLPKEVQEIIVELGNQYSLDVVKRGAEWEANAVSLMKSQGVTVSRLSDSERTRWAQRLSEARVAAKTVAAAQSHGYPALDIAKYYVKALEAEGYTFPYPPVLTVD